MVALALVVWILARRRRLKNKQEDLKGADEVVPTSVINEMDGKGLPRKELETTGAEKIELPTDESAQKVELETEENPVELPNDSRVELPAEIPGGNEKESEKSEASSEV